MINVINRMSLDMFLIPNAPQKVKDWKPAFNEPDYENEFRRSVLEPRLKTIGDFWGIPELDNEDYLVEFWAVDPTDEAPIGGHSNLNDHGYRDENGNHNRFPSFIPYSFVEGLVEHDSLNWSGSQGEFCISMNQLRYRYKRFGAFEDVLSAMMTRVKAYATK